MFFSLVLISESLAPKSHLASFPFLHDTPCSHKPKPYDISWSLSYTCRADIRPLAGHQAPVVVSSSSLRDLVVDRWCVCWWRTGDLGVWLLAVVLAQPFFSEYMMKQSKDPFEAAFVDQEESPPESPIMAHEIEAQLEDASLNDVNQPQNEVMDVINHPNIASTSAAPLVTTGGTQHNKIKDEEEEEEEENMDVELGKFPASGDPDKMSKMQAILSQFTEEQMNRYESYRRSGFQKSNMKRLLVSITGSQKISIPMTIVVSGIAKMFVGELVETARMVMTERRDSGPIRPCHMREAYRRLKLEGKVPRRSVPRLFR